MKRLIVAFCFVGVVATLAQITNVNTGTGPNTGDGDPARTAFTKINANFDYVWNQLTNSDGSWIIPDTISSNKLDPQTRALLGAGGLSITNPADGDFMRWSNNGSMYLAPTLDGTGLYNTLGTNAPTNPAELISLQQAEQILSTNSASAYGNILMNSADAAQARGYLGLSENNLGLWATVITPWATTEKTGTNTKMQIVYKTSSFITNCQFPSVCYDFARRRLLGAYISATNHWGTNASAYLIDCYDGGKVWQNNRELPFGTNVAHVGISSLADGTIVVLYAKREYPGGVPTYTNLYMAVSSDGTYTWTTTKLSLPGLEPPYAPPFMANMGIFEVQSGVWLLTAYQPPATITTNQVKSIRAAAFRSTDRGATWARVATDQSANEAFFSQSPQGIIYWTTRGDYYSPSATMGIWGSTNLGVDWDFYGKASVADYGASTPQTIFIGNRMVWTGRQVGTGGASILRYSDNGPYYTNGWTSKILAQSFGAYESPVKLSESVLLVLMANYPSGITGNIDTFTNGMLKSLVISQDGKGWLPAPTRFQLPQPDIYLSHDDITGGFGEFVTRWKNKGFYAVTVTNYDPSATSSVTVMKLSTNTEPVLWCNGRTNMTVGTSNLLSYLWTTNEWTVMFRASTTNSADLHWLMASANSTAQVGIRLKFWGGQPYLTQQDGTASDAGSYVLDNVWPYDSQVHTVAFRLSGNNARMWLDGAYASNLDTTNAGTKTLTTSTNATFPLTFGAYGSSTAGSWVGLADVLVFPYALTDGEIFSWMHIITP